MKKWWIVLLIVLGAVLTVAGLIAAAFIAIFALFGNGHVLEPLDGPGMVYEVVVEEIEYVRNDHVNGGIYRLKATRGATVQIEMERRANETAEPVRLTAEADESLLQKIGEAVRDGGLIAAGNHPERDPYRMPDVTARLTIVQPYQKTVVTSLMELSEREQTGWNTVVALLEQALDEPEYRLELGDDRYEYENARETYHAGELVELYRTQELPDAAYAFLLDGEPVSCRVDEQRGIAIVFLMPAHDAALVCVPAESPSTDAN